MTRHDQVRPRNSYERSNENPILKTFGGVKTFMEIVQPWMAGNCITGILSFISLICIVEKVWKWILILSINLNERACISLTCIFQRGPQPSFKHAIKTDAQILILIALYETWNSTLITGKLLNCIIWDLKQ